VVITITPKSEVEGFSIAGYKGIVKGATLLELRRNAEALGANAVVNTCFDDEVDLDTVYHGAAVVIEQIPWWLDGGLLRKQKPKRKEPLNG
jgi:uncharacterized protein YbjQ (UPF0145 family)